MEDTDEKAQYAKVKSYATGLVNAACWKARRGVYLWWPLLLALGVWSPGQKDLYLTILCFAFALTASWCAFKNARLALRLQDEFLMEHPRTRARFTSWISLFEFVLALVLLFGVLSRPPGSLPMTLP